jgi:TolB-like protein
VSFAVAMPGDEKIRQQIRDCALFLPIISQSTQARSEGYFRLEWRLAVQRTHLMGRSRAFLAPICVDATPERDADVPDSFSAVQWSRLPDGKPTPNFVARVEELLKQQTPGAVSAQPAQVGRLVTDGSSALRWRTGVVVAVVIAVAAGSYYFAVGARRELARASRDSSADPAPAASLAIPEKSAAVLPFVDMSEKKDQEYFGDGMAEEILDLLAKIPGLKVIGRTSSFQFKGRNADLQMIGTQLNAAYVLEGSVRKAGNQVRITAQLINTTREPACTSGLRHMTGISGMCSISRMPSLPLSSENYNSQWPQDTCNHALPSKAPKFTT